MLRVGSDAAGPSVVQQDERPVHGQAVCTHVREVRPAPWLPQSAAARQARKLGPQLEGFDPCVALEDEVRPIFSSFQAGVWPAC